MMRQILVDHAHKHSAAKRTLALEEDSSVTHKSLDLLALDDAMKRLADLDPSPVPDHGTAILQLGAAESTG